MMTPQPSNTHHLCEDCGYDVEGLSPSGICPECGRSVATSLPGHRRGSPFQQGPSLRSWAATSLRVFISPRGLFRALRIEPATGNVLLLINLILASALLVLPWVGVLIGDPAREARLRPGVIAWSTTGAMFVVWTIAGVVVLFGLTAVEYIGIRFIAARRKWRITPEGAWQVCCHASAGWITCGVLTLALTVLVQVALVRTPRLHGMVPLPTFLPVQISWRDLFTQLSLFGGVFLGMMTFETLVYFGVRACKFAASVPTISAAPPSGHAATLRV